MKFKPSNAPRLSPARPAESSGTELLEAESSILHRNAQWESGEGAMGYGWGGHVVHDIGMICSIACFIGALGDIAPLVAH